ncbi:MAG: tetratricopeptide repeat protein [Candidatus Cloacimonetes bacterium]|nr:tetratricopeptide repeat protein [Candidatus Cloacimonadota bacterium]
MRIIDNVSYRKIFYTCLILIYLIPLLSSVQVESSYIEPELITDFERIEILLEDAETTREIDPQKAIEIGNQIFNLAKTIHSDSLQIEALISLSASYTRLGNYSRSNEIGNKALKKSEEIKNNFLISKTLERYIFNSIVYNDLTTAFEKSSYLLKVNFEKSNEFVGLAYKYFGDIFFKIRNYEKALEYHKLSLEFFQNNKHKSEYILKSNIGYQYQEITSIGMDYQENGELNKALEYFFILLDITTQEDVYSRARALNHIGVVYIIQENFDKALEYCEQALQLFKIENKLHRMGNIYNDLARIYFLTGDFQKALEYNLISLENRKSLNLTILVASSYRNIADNYLDLENFDESERYYKLALNDATKMNDLVLQKYVHEKMAKLFEETNNFERSLAHYKDYLSLYKVLYDQDLQTKMVNEQFNLEITTIEQENQILKKTNTNLNQEVLKTKKISSSLMYGLILALVTLIFAIVIYYDKRKYSSKLEREVAEKTKELNNSRLVLKNIGSEKDQLQSEMLNLRYTFENLFQNLGEGVAIISSDEEFLSANPAAENIFGMKSMNLNGRNLNEFISLEEKTKIQDKILDFSDNKILSTELTIKRQKNDERYLILTATPITNSDGKVISILGIFRDITERKLDEDNRKRMLKNNLILLHELEHRVKNNLQLIYSIAGLLSNYTKENPNLLLKKFKSLIYVIVLMQDLVLPEDKHIIDLFSFINSIYTNQLSMIPNSAIRIKFINEVEIKEININYATPLGMIINELISNSIIHGFKDNKEPKIIIKFYSIDEKNILEYFDNGIGLDKKINISNPDSFGFNLINLQVRQLKGKLEIESSKGFKLKLTFKNLNLSTYSVIK